MMNSQDNSHLYKPIFHRLTDINLNVLMNMDNQNQNLDLIYIKLQVLKVIDLVNIRVTNTTHVDISPALKFNNSQSENYLHP